MSVAKVIEISASSQKSFEDATQQGIAKASETLDNVREAWVKEMKVIANGGKVKEYRVNLMISFELK